MKLSSFQTTIENQFDYICKRGMEDEHIDYFIQFKKAFQLNLECFFAF